MWIECVGVRVCVGGIGMCEGSTIVHRGSQCVQEVEEIAA